MMKEIYKYIFYLLLIFFFSCTQNKDEITLKYFQLENVFHYSDYKSHDATTIIFLSPQCPLSENYSKTLLDLKNQYTNNNIKFNFIVPGDKYADNEISELQNIYLQGTPVILDKKNDLVQRLNATTTPETFLINSKGKVVYSGAIDNWAVDLGTKRQVITEHYLENAIDALLNGAEVKIKTTDAVGCFIELGYE
ncbi:MAG: redoxin domain-containing protein [Fimbriimonadaceae bacterium]|nr:redoxin domain-containing protein [Chitinophagales bacterium]